MKPTVLLATMLLASLASAATYKVKIADPVVVNGKELKPGDYKVEVTDTTAVLRNGKDATEVKVKVESNQRKYDSDAVRFTTDGGKNNLEEIHIGGTKTKLVIEAPKTANGGE